MKLAIFQMTPPICLNGMLRAVTIGLHRHTLDSLPQTAWMRRENIGLPFIIVSVGETGRVMITSEMSKATAKVNKYNVMFVLMFDFTVSIFQVQFFGSCLSLNMLPVTDDIFFFFLLEINKYNCSGILNLIKVTGSYI